MRAALAQCDSPFTILKQRNIHATWSGHVEFLLAPTFIVKY